MSRIFSFSQKSKFDACPLKYKKAYIGEDRKKDLPNEPMIKGKEIHQDIADYLDGNGPRPDNLPDNFDSFLMRLGEGDAHIETKISIDFIRFSLVGYIDLYIVDRMKLKIVDWKSGWKDGEDEQLMIYAAGLIEEHPEAMIIEGYFFYTAKGYWTRKVWTRDEIEAYMIKLESDLNRMYEATEYPANPCDLCKTCQYSWECAEVQKYEFIRITNEQEYINLDRRLKMAEGFCEMIKEAKKQYMVENDIPLIIDGARKSYLSTTVTMRSGKLKKDEMIDIILEARPHENKKELKKMKVEELVIEVENLAIEQIEDEAKEQEVEEEFIADDIKGTVSETETVESEFRVISEKLGPDIEESFLPEEEADEIVNVANKYKEVGTTCLADHCANWSNKMCLRGHAEGEVNCPDFDDISKITQKKEQQPEQPKKSKDKIETCEIPEKITLGMIKDLAVERGLIENTKKSWDEYYKKMKDLYEGRPFLNFSAEEKEDVYRWIWESKYKYEK